MSLNLLKRITSVVLLILLCLSIFFRFYRLDMGSYWYDEIVSVNLAKHTPTELILGEYLDPADTPLHPMLLSIWMRYVGDSEKMTRLLSGVISVAAIAVFAMLTSEYVKNRFISFVTVVMFGATWMHVFAARETRYYSLLLLLSSLGTYVFGLVLRKQTKLTVFVFALISVLGILTHYGYAVLIMGFVAVWMITAGSVNVLLYIFLVTCFSVLALLPRLDLTVFGSGVSFWDFVNTLFQYEISGKISETPMNIPSIVQALLYGGPDSMRIIFVVLFLGSLVYLIKRHVLSRHEASGVLLFGVLVVISLLTPVAVILNNWYYYYFLTPAFFLVFGIVANRLFATPKGVVGVVALVCIFMGTNVAYMTNYTSHFNTWHLDETVDDIIDGKIPVIVFGNGDLRFIVDHYLIKRSYSGVIVYNGDDYFPKYHPGVYTAFVAYAENVPFWEKVHMSMMLANNTVKKTQASGNNVLVKFYAPK